MLIRKRIVSFPSQNLQSFKRTPLRCNLKFVCFESAGLDKNVRSNIFGIVQAGLGTLSVLALALCGEVAVGAEFVFAVGKDLFQPLYDPLAQFATNLDVLPCRHVVDIGHIHRGVGREGCVAD